MSLDTPSVPQDPPADQAPDPPAPASQLPDPIPDIILGGGITLLAGLPGAGKTRLLAWWARTFLDGGQLFGHAVRQMPSVGVIATDRSWATSSRRWFELLNLGHIPFYALADDVAFKFSRFREKDKRAVILDHCCEQLYKRGGLQPGGLVFVDTFSMFLGTLMDPDAIAIGIHEARRVIQAYQTTVIGTMHAGKQKKATSEQYVRLIDRIAGSVALQGYTDTQIYLAIPQEIEEKHHLLEWHPHHAPACSFPLEVDPEGRFTWPGKVYSEGLDAAKAFLKIVPLVSPEPAGTASAVILELAEAIGIPRRTAWRYLQHAVRDGHLKKLAQGYYRRIIPS